MFSRCGGNASYELLASPYTSLRVIELKKTHVGEVHSSHQEKWARWEAGLSRGRDLPRKQLLGRVWVLPASPPAASHDFTVVQGLCKLEALPSVVRREFNARFLEILLDSQGVSLSGTAHTRGQQASLGSILSGALERIYPLPPYVPVEAPGV